MHNDSFSQHASTHTTLQLPLYHALSLSPALQMHNTTTTSPARLHISNLISARTMPSYPPHPNSTLLSSSPRSQLGMRPYHDPYKTSNAFKEDLAAVDLWLLLLVFVLTVCMGAYVYFEAREELEKKEQKNTSGEGKWVPSSDDEGWEDWVPVKLHKRRKPTSRRCSFGAVHRGR